MKYIVNFMLLVFVGYPFMVLGYLYGAAKSGFDTGVFFYDRHETAAHEKFCTWSQVVNQKEDGKP